MYSLSKHGHDSKVIPYQIHSSPIAVVISIRVVGQLRPERRVQEFDCEVSPDIFAGVFYVAVPGDVNKFLQIILRMGFNNKHQREGHMGITEPFVVILQPVKV